VNISRRDRFAFAGEELAAQKAAAKRKICNVNEADRRISEHGQKLGPSFAR